MKILVIALISVFCVTATSAALAQFIAQPEPEYPVSERSREGWVVLDSSVNDGGVVVDLSIEDSSGSDAFNEAAMNAVREWRFEPAEERQVKVLVNFIFARNEVHLSKKFMSSIEKVHKSIEKGELDDAMDRIEAIRESEHLSAYELAYSLIAEGRVASVRGDKAGQLQAFRRAVINNGRWLEQDKYLMLLHAMAVLEVQQNDFSSALNTFALLSKTAAGKKLAEDLEQPMQAVQAHVAAGGNFAPPYAVSNLEITIEIDRRILSQDVDFRDDYFGEVANEDVNPRLD